MHENVISKFILFVLCMLHACECVYYDTWTGRTISLKDVQRHEKSNSSFWCTINVAPCDPHEWRRIDGSCNNLNYQTRGAAHTPVRRLLDSHFNQDFDERLGKDGEKLPLPRLVRTTIIPQGEVPDKQFTQLVSYFAGFMFSDVTSIHDTLNYILWKTYCCDPRGKKDRDCVPNIIPDNDPVHRFSDIRCMNLTRPFTFQSKGCAPNDTIPNRIISATVAIDLSMLYGISKEKLDKSRLRQGGLLKYEVEEGRIWPPSIKTNYADQICLLNQKPRETRCHQIPEEGNNSVFGQNLVLIWFWRHHNRIAEQLRLINPCWDDERLFNTAKDMNIAIATQIFYYEFWTFLLGHQNMVLSGILSPQKGHRDEYNERITPQTSIEYLTVMRWFHTVQNGMLKLYDQDGYYLKQYPIVNITLRTGFLAVDDAIDQVTQGSFRQRLGKSDHLIDPYIAELALGPHQRATDVTTSDLSKNRLYGLAPYIHYVNLCFGIEIKHFDDLLQVMDEERVEILKEIYKDVEDIDLLAGIWSEKHVWGGHVPQTFFCIVGENLRRNMISDRHWYERKNRPHAFTLPQLLEVRKATIARLLCDVGDKITRIQPHAFIRPQPGNEICSCNELPAIDFYAWKDDSCDANASY